jgi:RNA polymerase sigma-32 factor
VSKKLDKTFGRQEALKGKKRPLKVTEEPEVEVLAPESSTFVSPFSAAEADEDVIVVDVSAAEFPDAEPSPEPSAEPLTTASERRGSKGSALVPYSPLDAYLSEIRRFSPLSREEEHDVALEYQKTKSSDSAYRLVSSNLWLVVKLARDYERVARNLLDLIQEGNIGLMEAVKNFDPYRGVRFPSYAVWWIRAYIIRYIIANWRLVKIGTTQAQRKLFFNLKKESERLERQGIYPSARLLAEKLDVREGDVVEMTQRLNGPDVSVDAPLQDDSDSSLLSLLPSDRESAEDLMARKEMRQILHRSIEDFESGLTEKEKLIFHGRVLDEDKLTLQEISDQLSLSKERVRQIENKLKERLKIFLSTQMGVELEEWVDSNQGG